MLIKSSTALRNEYDALVNLSREQQEPIYITRNGEGEMVFPVSYTHLQVLFSPADCMVSVPVPLPSMRR